MIIASTIIFIFCKKRYDQDYKDELFSELLNKLNNISNAGIEEMLENVDPDSSLLAKNKINIIAQYDQFASKAVSSAIWHHLTYSSTQGITIIFDSTSNIMKYQEKINSDCKYGVLSLDQLSIKEKELLRDTYGCTLPKSKLRYFGVDAIVSTIYDAIDSTNATVQQKLLNLHEKSKEYSCDVISILYLLTRITGFYDIYLNRNEMIEYIKFCIGNNIRGINRFIGQRTGRSIPYEETVDLLIERFNNDLIMRSGRYKFKTELNTVIFSSDSLSRIRNYDLLYCELNYILNVDNISISSDLRLHQCAIIFKTLKSDDDAFSDHGALFDAMIKKLLSYFKKNSYYYFHDAIFDYILAYSRRIQNVEKRLFTDKLIFDAAFDNFVFSPGHESWEQFREFTVRRAIYHRNVSNVKSTESFQPVPVYYGIASCTDDEREQFYHCLMRLDEKRVDEFLRVLYSYFVHSKDLDLADSNFAIFKVEQQPIDALIAHIDIPHYSSAFKSTIDENVVYLLIILAEYFSYQVIKLITTLLIGQTDSNDDKNYFVVDDNLTYELVYHRHSTKGLSADFARMITLIENSAFSKELIHAYFLAICVYPSMYRNEIVSLLSIHKELTGDIVRGAINNDWSDEKAFFDFFHHILLINDMLEGAIEIENIVIDVLRKRDRSYADNITAICEIYNNKVCDPAGTLETKIMASCPNLAFTLLNNAVEANNVTISALGEPQLINVILQAQMVGVFYLTCDYLLSCKEGRAVKLFLFSFIIHSSSCRTKIGFDKAFEVMRKHKTELSQMNKYDRLMTDFIVRELQMYREEAQRNIFRAENPLLVCLYIHYIYRRFVIPLTTHVNGSAIEERYDITDERILYEFLSHDAIFSSDGAVEHFPPFNQTYFDIVISAVSRTHIHAQLVEIYGKATIVESLRSNAVKTLQHIMKQNSIDGGIKNEIANSIQALESIETRQQE